MCARALTVESRAIRETSGLLHAAEIANALARVHRADVRADSWAKINSARHSLALTQHHDGVTGTAKQYVVNDYLNKLDKARRDSTDVLCEAAGYLLSKSDERTVLTVENGPVKFSGVDQVYEGEHSEENDQDQPIKPLVVQNPNAWDSEIPITLRVDRAHMHVLDSSGAEIDCQVR